MLKEGDRAKSNKVQAFLFWFTVFWSSLCFSFQDPFCISHAVSFPCAVVFSLSRYEHGTGFRCSWQGFYHALFVTSSGIAWIAWLLMLMVVFWVCSEVKIQYRLVQAQWLNFTSFMANNTWFVRCNYSMYMWRQILFTLKIHQVSCVLSFLHKNRLEHNVEKTGYLDRIYRICICTC